MSISHGVTAYVFSVLAAFFLVQGTTGCGDKNAPAAVSETAKPIDIDSVRTKAESGDAQAQADLGRAYSKGEGVKQSYSEAAKWYLKSAEQGNAIAQNALGEL